MHGVKRVTLTKELQLEKERKEKAKLDRFLLLSTKIDALNGKDKKDQELKQLLSYLDAQLIINPDLTTSYNLRRDSILQLEFSSENWDEELNYTMMLLTKAPKSYGLWQHRCWILSQLDSSIYYEKELKLTLKLLSLDKRNFHGWAYRRDILDILSSRLGASEIDELYSKEWEFLTEMINSDISNYSAWHQRRTLLLYYLDSQTFKAPKSDYTSMKDLLVDEVEYLYQAIFTDAEDQSVWNYLKWFITESKVRFCFTGEENEQILEKYIQAMLEINEDESEFNGKWNKWCSLLLIYIKDHLCVDRDDIDKNLLLESLIKSDPLRKNRYLEMLQR